MFTAFRASSARSGFALGLCAGLIAASAGFLLYFGTSSKAGVGTTPATAPAPTVAHATSGSTAPAGSMESATLALAARLSAQGGPDDQWNLLAQSYEFLGRPADAELARQHRVSGSGDLRDAVMATAALLPGSKPMSGAPTVTGGGDRRARLIASAEDHRRKREFAPACAAYAELAKMNAMDADTWADYADARAALSGGLAGEPETYLDKSLALDPRNAKALWLKASLQHEQHRYKDAVATWKRLLAVVPPGSSDALIVQANIAEASRLGSG